MSYKTIYSLCIFFCLYACTDDRFSSPDPVVSPSAGKIVLGNLSLEIEEPPVLRFSDDQGSAQAAGSVSVLKASFSGMDVELSGKPVADTRTLPQVDVNKIVSLAIFQFNGTSDTESVCTKYQFLEPGADGEFDLSLFQFGEVSPDVLMTRIVVFANLPQSYFSTTIWEDRNSEENRFGKLKKLFMTHGGEQMGYPLYSKNDVTGRVIMYGVTDVHYEASKQITVVLHRVFAEVNLNISIASTISSGYKWTAQLMNLPERCYLLPVGRPAPFPGGSALGGDNGYYNIPISDPSIVPDGGSNKIVFNDSYYVPVNVEPDVVIATHHTRSELAPFGATYIQIVGLKFSTTNSDAISDQLIYNVYLGHNFTTNYSILPNHRYTYTINVNGKSTDDASLVKLIPGYWGGELKAYAFTEAEVASGAGFPADQASRKVTVDSEDAVKWKYEYKIEAYPIDLKTKVGTTMAWGLTGSSYGAISLTDGLSNNGSIPAANFNAFNNTNVLNAGADSFTNHWYVPSIAQLMATYLVTANLYSTMSENYWSSTASDANGTDAFYITRYGIMKEHLKTDSTFCSVRPVRNLKN